MLECILEQTGEALVVRSCSIESLHSQCGVFSLDDEFFNGCLLTCHWSGCNTASKPVAAFTLTLLVAGTSVYMYMYMYVP